MRECLLKVASRVFCAHEHITQDAEMSAHHVHLYWTGGQYWPSTLQVIQGCCSQQNSAHQPDLHAAGVLSVAPIFSIGFI